MESFWSLNQNIDHKKRTDDNVDAVTENRRVKCKEIILELEDKYYKRKLSNDLQPQVFNYFNKTRVWGRVSLMGQHENGKGRTFQNSHGGGKGVGTSGNGMSSFTLI